MKCNNKCHLIVGMGAILLLSMARAGHTEQTAPRQIEVDASVKSLQVTLAPGRIQLKVVNLVPDAAKPYEFRIVDKLVLEAPLDTTQFMKNGLADAARCLKQAAAILTRLKAAASESMVRQILGNARTELKTEGQCSDDGLEVELGKLKLATSYLVNEPVALREGHEIKLEVVREGKIISEHTFSPPVSSAWLMSYGFTFVRDKNQAYSTAPITGSAGTFQINRSQRDADYKFVPSLFLARRTDDQEQRSWCFGCRMLPAFGIGTDLEDISAFLGIGFLYGDNVMVTLGGAMTRQDRLNGRYRTGQSVQEELTNEQLVKKTWSTTFYLGITLRVGESTLSLLRGDEKKEAKSD